MGLVLSPPILEEISRVLQSPRLRRLIRLTAAELDGLIGDSGAQYGVPSFSKSRYWAPSLYLWAKQFAHPGTRPTQSIWYTLSANTLFD